MSSRSTLVELIDVIENILTAYYELEIDCPASNCIVPTKAPFRENRSGEVLLVEDEDLFIGILISQDTQQNICFDKPTSELSRPELNALLVVIEEVSHFHLICDRAKLGQPTTLLELEWQSEVDKIIVLESLVRKHSHAVDPMSLFRVVADETDILSNLSAGEASRYLDASIFFRLFWKKLVVPELAKAVSNPTMRGKNIRSVLKKYYRLPWYEKFKVIAA